MLQPEEPFNTTEPEPGVFAWGCMVCNILVHLVWSRHLFQVAPMRLREEEQEELMMMRERIHHGP